MSLSCGMESNVSEIFLATSCPGPRCQRVGLRAVHNRSVRLSLTNFKIGMPRLALRVQAGIHASAYQLAKKDIVSLYSHHESGNLLLFIIQQPCRSSLRQNEDE